MGRRQAHGGLPGLGSLLRGNNLPRKVSNNDAPAAPREYQHHKPRPADRKAVDHLAVAPGPYELVWDQA